jgi:hypothetical protein
MLDMVEPTGLVCGYRVDGAGVMEELAWADMDGALEAEDRAGSACLNTFLRMISGASAGFRLPRSATAG